MRRVGHRLVAAVAATSLLAIPSTGHAATRLLNTSFSSGWATNTIQFGEMDGGQRLKAPSQADPTDPPYFYSHGQIRYLLARFGTALCTEPTVAPVVTVLDADGNQLTGTVTLQSFGSDPRPTVVRWTVDDPQYPHGLAAGRADGTGGGAPFSVQYSVNFLKLNGTCDAENTENDGPFFFAIDRNLPASPTITGPRSLFSLSQFVCLQQPCYPIAVPSVVRGPVIAKGTASDTLTRPFTEMKPSLSALETSGIKAVVLTLYKLDTLRTSYEFDRSFMWLNPDCNRPHPVLDTISACSNAVNWEIDLTSSLEVGGTYEFKVYSIDLAGYRTPVPSSKAATTDNANGPPDSPPLGRQSFVYAG